MSGNLFSTPGLADAAPDCHLPEPGSTRNPVPTVFAGWRRLALAALAACALGLAGCGGGGSGIGVTNLAGNLAGSQDSCVPGDASSAENCGTLLISLTDAEGDLLAYAVDVTSIRLYTAAGNGIEVLPGETRVDFAALADVAELVGVTQVPPGLYVEGSITLDYVHAEVYVEAGGDMVAAHVVNEDGDPLQQVTVAIALAADQPLLVQRQQTANLSLDFDLAASHVVDTTFSPPVVTARPFIIAEVHPVVEKPLRVRGALVAVDVAAGVYSVRVRPWHRPAGDHGTMRVHTTEDTRFDIEGSLYTGTDGLRALAQLPAGTLTIAAGTLDLATRRFTADRVHAGDSVPGVQSAAVYGNVLRRDGNTLVVGAALAVRPGHIERVFRRVSVSISADTRVYMLARPPVLLDADAISVGQRVVAFGSWTDHNEADPGTPLLDATDGRVRMDQTHLRGTVVDVQSGQIDVALRAIDRLGVGLFDFTGTGMVPELDADPSRYRVATGVLPLSGVQLDQPVGVAGIVMPFGAAPPDFRARSVTTAQTETAVAATLGIGWGLRGTRAPFNSVGAGGIVLDLSNPDIGLRHHLKVGASLISLRDLPSAPLIVPAPGRTLYGVWLAGEVHLYGNFEAFTEALNRHLGAGNALQSLAAHGSYDRGTGQFSADRLWVHVVQH